MNITAVRIFPFETREAGGRTVAYAEIEIDGGLLVRGLRVMDTTALSLCMDDSLPIHVFELAGGNIRRVASGERVGTIIRTVKEA